MAVDRILLTHDDRARLGWRAGAVDGRRDRPCATIAAWADEPAHADDNRWVHRPRDAVGRGRAPARRAGRSSTGSSTAWCTAPGCGPASSTSTRRCAAEPLDPTDPGVLVVLRRHPVGPLLGLYNVTDTERPFPAWRLAAVGLEPALTIDALIGPVHRHRPQRRSPAPALRRALAHLIRGSSIRVFEPIGVLSLDFLDLQHSDGRKHSDGLSRRGARRAVSARPAGRRRRRSPPSPPSPGRRPGSTPSQPRPPDVRRAEEALRLLLDELLLDTRRRGAPDGQAAVVVVVVEEHDERLLAAHEERRRRRG